MSQIKASKEYILKLLKEGKRLDGRKLDEFRKPIKIEYGISNKAEGSARVIIGETIVAAGVKLEVGEAYPDTPDQGAIMVGAEMLPLSSPDFEMGPPNNKSIELARVVDRGIRESHAIDLKKLCIKSGEKVWMVCIDIYTLNDAGNLQDAASLAASGALMDAKLPTYNEKEDKVDYKKRTGKIPLVRKPLEVTLIKIGDEIVADASLAEEEVMDSKLTIAVDDNGMLCALQKGGSGTLTSEDVKKMTAIAIKRTADLRKVL